MTTVRRVTEADLPLLRELWLEFEREVPEPPHRYEPPEQEWPEIPEYVEKHLALVAERDGAVVGYALAKLQPPRIVCLSDVYVRSGARRYGVGKALMAAVAAWGAERGADTMTLEVLTSNKDARAVYDRLGFVEESRNLYASLDVLGQRFAAATRGATFGSIHVQTDDLDAVVRAVTQFVPRLPGGSRGSVVAPPRNGWTAVYDELCDREPEMLRRLAREISDRMGSVVLVLGLETGVVVRYIVLERGRVVDEYASVPEYHGPLPPGDVVALGANPTVLARLTGADPAQVRAVARSAPSPGELPPGPELLAAVADVLGIEGATHGHDAGHALPGAVVLARS